MRTRTFLGLILLVAALIVASTPALLTPTANGVEQLAIEAGVLEDQKALAKERAKAQEEREKERGVAVEDRLEIKGFVEEQDGDLRDTKPVGDREVNERGRLEAGSARLMLPGQKPGTDAYSPPFAAEDGVLLDIDGCPVFRPEANVAAMMADPDTKTLYDGKVTTSDDAAACRVVFDERVAIATADDSGEPSGAMGRRMAGLQYESLESLGITVSQYELLLDIFDFSDPADALAAADETTGTSGAAATGDATTGAGAPAATRTAATATQ